MAFTGTNKYKRATIEIKKNRGRKPVFSSYTRFYIIDDTNLVIKRLPTKGYYINAGMSG
jgi:hypothetical protein